MFKEKLLVGALIATGVAAVAFAKAAKDKTLENEVLREQAKKTFDDSKALGKEVVNVTKAAFNDAKDKVKEKFSKDKTDDFEEQAKKYEEEAAEDLEEALNNFENDGNTEDTSDSVNDEETFDDIEDFEKSDVAESEDGETKE